ncbi:16S rRNA (uracil(1498)-N(3))-methyltransferase [Mycoplasma sp. 'Moose RK']|uniref:16S rRNA (uracil(1498)-N(3))-methyltransferase n=1 Tax=Mycoplasma sp. 'Moose RK' TaxID=2780095 RepID=UPI0018C250C2|nr:16S rRNA (uracil(1498)-N(3))-methyltransferase [Mycoplasma sp. 'Moose RK']MBG0730599.1 16S rRNA (uracil(1498)-N(3))-methyltransferase [Mycoplasma sp. 'Moose RK']
MFRFFVEKKQENFFVLSEFTLKHIKTVRIEHENFICVFEGKFYLTKLLPKSNLAKIISEIDLNNEPNNKVTLAIAIIKTKSFEFAIQKAIEIGVSEIWPFYSKNVSQKLGNDLNKKLDRWQLICLHSAQQSFRNFVPKILPPTSFAKILEKSSDFSTKLIAHEKAKTAFDFTKIGQKTILIVGPEGGFADDEVDLAQKANFQAVSLGKRVLRSETAAIFLLSKCVND